MRNGSRAQDSGVIVFNRQEKVRKLIEFVEIPAAAANGYQLIYEARNPISLFREMDAT